jgi:SPP1 family predicted phage head-tail adaptor
MSRGLLDSRMASKLGRFYPSRCTIQIATNTRGTAGSKVSTFADDPTRLDLPCAIAPVSGKEIERDNQTVVIATHRIAFATTVDVTEAERARIGAVVYDILAVQTDSHEHATYLDCEVVS